MTGRTQNMKADYILKSKAIYTGVDEMPFEGGVVVIGNKIEEVFRGNIPDGYAADDIRDYGDRLIMPGFIDNHDHFFAGALTASKYMNMEIINSKSEEECIAMMKEFAEEHPDFERVLGMGWSLGNWGTNKLPSKESLDAVFPDRPVYLINFDIHTFWMNTKALEESGISPDMQPRSGSIGVDENGDLTGILQEPDAFGPAMNIIQTFPYEKMIEVDSGLIRQAIEWGVTSIGEMSADGYMDSVHNKYKMVRKMLDEGHLKVRLHVYPELIGHEDFSVTRRWMEEFNTDKFRISGVKGFVDGVTSTYTALLQEPYSDNQKTCGMGAPIYSGELMQKSITAANRAGLQVRLHCIGDGAVKMALDMYEESQKINGRDDYINGIEHIESINPDDIPRFRELNVMANVQPYHLPLDEMEKLIRTGEKRCRWEWPFRSMLDAGADMSFGTDYPVTDFNPYKNIFVAVTRKNLDGTECSVNPEQCVTVLEALKAYTSQAARSYRREDIGILRKGNLADIIVTSRNLFKIDPDDIAGCMTEMTMFNGEILFDKLK